MKLEYYNFEDLLSFDFYQDKIPVFQKNYKTKELAIDSVVKQYNPNFTLHSIKFDDLRLFKEVEIEYPIYHSKKIDKKTGKLKIIGTDKKKVTNVDKDYCDYNISEGDFKQRAKANYLNKKGFYKINLFAPVHEIIEGNLVYKNKVFVKFFDAKINITLEVKESGKPYQAYKCEVIENEISDWLPVFYTKYDGYSSQRFFLSPLSSSIYKNPQEYFVEKIIYITKRELEIEE